LNLVIIHYTTEVFSKEAKDTDFFESISYNTFMLDKLLGNASQLNSATVQAELQHVLLDDEVVQSAYSVFRDMFIFTNRRLLLVDKQGVTGTKMSLRTIPYKSIKSFSIETAGKFDMDSELRIWLVGSETPISKTFRKGDLIFKVQEALVAYVCIPGAH
jgi:hypothetical protein